MTIQNVVMEKNCIANWTCMFSYCIFVIADSMIAWQIEIQQYKKKY